MDHIPSPPPPPSPPPRSLLLLHDHFVVTGSLSTMARSWWCVVPFVCSRELRERSEEGNGATFRTRGGGGGEEKKKIGLGFGGGAEHEGSGHSSTK